MSASSFIAAERLKSPRDRRKIRAFVSLSKSLTLLSFFFSCVLPAASQAQVECVISTSMREQFLVVKAIATSPTAMSGTYRLMLTRQGVGSMSQSIQQGKFDYQPGSDGLLSTTIVNLANKTQVSATLLIETDRGTSQCGLPK